MLSPEMASDRAAALIERARRAGADMADAVYSADSSESVSVRLGSLEDVERSESEHISLRVFSGSRSASIGSSDMSDSALDELAARAVAMARLAPEDPYSGLAPQELLSNPPFPALDLDDPAEPSPAALRAIAETAEDAARAVAAGIFERAVLHRDGEGHAAGFGRDAQVAEQSGQVRIVLFVVDDEARVDRDPRATVCDFDRMAVAAQARLGLEQKDAMPS